MNSAESFFIAPLASKFHQREIGTGHLIASNGGKVGCRFILEQTPSGAISLRCLLDTVQEEAWRKRPLDQEWYAEHKNLQFDLVTDDDFRLENIRFHSTGGITDYSQRRTYEFDLSSLELRRIRPLPVERPVEFAEFSIVNYNVEGGNSCVRFSNFWKWDSNVVALKFSSRECWLHPSKDADQIIKRLEATKGIDVTAQIMMPLSSLEEWEATEQLVDKLCTVLTLLSGNRVTWISARAIDAYGYAKIERWRDSVTNPYTSEDILNILANDRVYHRIETSSYIPIIEQMMGHFDEVEEKWKIREAIHTWHETVISDHFQTQRGLLISAGIDMLRSRYLKQGGRELIVSNELFNSKKNLIGRYLKKCIKHCFPPPAEWDATRKDEHNQDLSMMYSHVKNLNRFPFGQSLKQMAQELDIKAFGPDGPEDNIEQRWALHLLKNTQTNPEYVEASIKCFVKIRDQLTHQGTFVLSPADQINEASESAGLEGRRQLQFLQRFAAAFLCSALGWKQPLPAALILPKSET